MGGHAAGSRAPLRRRPLGLDVKRLRHIPQSTVDRARRLSEVHRNEDVASILGLFPSQISKMRRNGWKATDYSCKVRARPTDFAIQATGMTIPELMRHYRAAYKTVRRWMDEAKPRKSWRGSGLTKAARAARAAAKPARVPEPDLEPSPAACFRCGLSVDQVEGCSVADCPFRARTHRAPPAQGHAGLEPSGEKGLPVARLGGGEPAFSNDRDCPQALAAPQK